jgi:inhibitor of cysteine peptidase
MPRSFIWRKLALLCVFLCLISLGGSGPRIESAPPLSVMVFGEPLPFSPSCVVVAGRVYAPAEPLALALGFEYRWDSREQTVYLNSRQRLSASHHEETYNGYPRINLILNDSEWRGEDPAILLNSAPYLPLRVAEALGISVGWESSSRTAYIGSPSRYQLPTVGSIANLEKLLAQGNFNYPYLFGGLRGTVADQAVGEATLGAEAAPSATPEHSTTNNQVQGVDEADLVKTDGRCIYQAKGQTVLITRAYPASDMALVSSIDLTDQHLTVRELFLDEDRLLVLGEKAYWDYPIETRDIPYGRVNPAPDLMPLPPYWQQQTCALVFDISDPAAPQSVRTVELAGSYLTARKVESRVVVLSNQALFGRPVAPHFRDSARGKEQLTLSMQKVQYFPERHDHNYLLTAVFDLGQDDQPAQIAAYLGAGNNIYMSPSNLYVATHSWLNNESCIYKLHLEGTELSFAAKGKVPGHVLNQFSMDEWQGDLRVATTYDQDGMTNNGIYILDQEMALTGQLDGIAPGERIYSARFQGARGYLVTFEQVDPLFVLDLSNPEDPAILGVLKIPGFSTYLHPLDDQHLLGIGRDTELVEDKDSQGQVISTRVLERGLKLAIFDVSDLNNPKEKFVVLLGGRGSYSEALYNHKAVLFSPSLQLLTLPVQLTETTLDHMSWGPVVYQGAIAYHLDTDDGFQELGRVSHFSEDELLKMGYYWTSYEMQIRRLLYIGDHLYAVSDGMISASKIGSMEMISCITLP